MFKNVYGSKYLIICLQKLNEVMPSGNLKTEWSRSRLRAGWKLEIGSWLRVNFQAKLANYESRYQETQGVSIEKDRYLREHCWLAVKNAANWLSCFENQVQLQLALVLILLALMLETQLSQHTWEKDRTVRNLSQRNHRKGGWRGRHGYLHDGETCFYYGVAGSDDLLICFMHWGCPLFWCSCLKHGNCQFGAIKSACPLRDSEVADTRRWAASGWKCQGRFLFPVHHCY